MQSTGGFSATSWNASTCPITLQERILRKFNLRRHSNRQCLFLRHKCLKCRCKHLHSSSRWLQPPREPLGSTPLTAELSQAEELQRTYRHSPYVPKDRTSR